MRIGEVARRTGVSISRIRFYEASGLLNRPERRSNNYRDYGARSIDRLRLIDDAQRLGFTLAQIRDALAAAPAGAMPLPHLLRLLRCKRDELDRMLDDLIVRQRDVDALIHRLENCGDEQKDRSGPLGSAT